jgi:hypothetical protein
LFAFSSQCLARHRIFCQGHTGSGSTTTVIVPLECAVQSN